MTIKLNKRVTGRRDSEQTRESLISAGAELFADLGFDGATVDLIARRARTNKAMINYHFGGKEGLYRAILIATFEPMLERLKVLPDSERTADLLLREFVEQFTGMVARRPGLPAMILREALSGGRRLDREVLPCFLSVFAAVRGIIEKGVREGTFRRVDPLLTHLSLIGSLVFFFSTASFRNRLIAEGWIPVDPPTPEEYALHVADLMSHGLAARDRGNRDDKEK